MEETMVDIDLVGRFFAAWLGATGSIIIFLIFLFLSGNVSMAIILALIFAFVISWSYFRYFGTKVNKMVEKVKIAEDKKTV
jgi:membrane protein implicated in regulation of membrane protease activity